MKKYLLVGLLVLLLLISGCTQSTPPAVVYQNLSSTNNTLTYDGGVAIFNDLNVTTGFTGVCSNVTYSAGIAVSCND